MASASADQCMLTFRTEDEAKPAGRGKRSVTKEGGGRPPEKNPLGKGDLYYREKISRIRKKIKRKIKKTSRRESRLLEVGPKKKTKLKKYKRGVDCCQNGLRRSRRPFSRICKKSQLRQQPARELHSFARDQWV